jgi:hypothetical protein
VEWQGQRPSKTNVVSHFIWDAPIWQGLVFRDIIMAHLCLLYCKSGIWGCSSEVGRQETSIGL